MTIQFEKTKSVLELIKLDIRSYIERLEEILEEIIVREKKILDQKDKKWQES